MASVRKRGERWQVLWRDPDGTQRGESFASKRAADAHKREVEDCVAAGRRWQPPDAGKASHVDEMTAAYIRDRARLLAPNTLAKHATILDLWRRWLPGATSGMRGETILSREMLGRFYDYLRSTPSRLGKPRTDRTCQAYVLTVSEFWQWAADHEEFRGVPRWRAIELRQPTLPPRAPAPTWAQMDAVIVELERSTRRAWLGRLAVVMRCTGLRVHQAASLTWGDFDLSGEIALLTIRGELGKTDAERRGRTVPVSQVLVDELRTWSHPQLGRVVGGPTGRSQGRRERVFGDAWEATGAPAAIWTGRPEHSFRRGFQTGLIGGGADPFAVEVLLGHLLPGQLDTYTDPRAWKLRQAVDLVPPIARPLDTLGAVLRAKMTARGLTATSLGELVGVRTCAVNSWLRDETIPPKARLSALGELLGFEAAGWQRFRSAEVPHG